MKISVIVPLYKGKCYIKDVTAMIGQNLAKLTSEYEVELIFVNDFPEEVISEEDVANDLCPTKLIVNEVNRGIHFSRVAGLKEACGEYIMFFDQDDSISENYLASQLETVKKNRGASVIVANGIAQAPDWDKRLYRYYPMQWTVKHMWFYTRFDCRIISPGQCLIKKEDIPQIWYEEIMTENGADDYFLWLYMLSQGKRFAINRDVLYTHVFTANNTSLDNDKMHASVRQILDIDEKHHFLPEKHRAYIEARIRPYAKKKPLVTMMERINRK